MFQGSYVALITPMTEDGQIDYAAYKALLEWHIEQGTDGLVILGTTGEAPTILPAERERLIKEALTVVANRVPVIVGAGSNGTQASIEQVKQTAQLKPDAILLATPYYNKPTQDGIYQHVKAIDTEVSLPLILYNVPGRTSCDILPETAARCAELKNVVAIKDATGDISRVPELKQAGLSVLSGDDATMLALLKAGGDGGISVTANAVPKQLKRLCQAVFSQDFTAAEAINARLEKLNEALFIESNPIPVKWLLAKLGKCASGLRLPLTKLSAQYHQSVFHAYEEAVQ